MRWTPLVLLLAWCACSSPAPSGHEVLEEGPGRPLQQVLRGITAERVDELDALVEAVAAHSAVPTVRVVFEPDADVGDYAAALARLRPHAYLVGELIDSEALSGFSIEEVRARASAFADAYGDLIDIWEIGNELNGGWVGSGPDEINPKVQAAYDVLASERGYRTAITLNYWSDANCYDAPWEATLDYAQGMPATLRAGVSYVTLSIYETACSPPQKPTAASIAAALDTLGDLFPSAALAIGEVGAQRAQDGVPDPSLATKQRIAGTYYGMHADLARMVGPRFVGGYFWWYYVADAVPREDAASLWPTLEELLSTL